MVFKEGLYENREGHYTKIEKRHSMAIDTTVTEKRSSFVSTVSGEGQEVW